MRHTYKASFEQQDDAQHLLDELIAAGYTQATLALSGATHAGPYTRQRPAVTLTVDSEQDAQRALGLMERSHPARLQDDMPDEEDDWPVQAPAYPPGAKPGALQFHPIEDGRLFGTQDAAAPPAGTTFQERMGAPSLWPDVDETFIASREAAQRLDPDERTAADSDPYPSAMPEDQAVYPPRRHSLRERFESAFHHGRQDTGDDAGMWHKVREAVRHGWDRVRS